MNFHSILFKNKIELIHEAPSFFVDLNLEQVVNTIIYGKEEYNLKPFFYTSLYDKDEIIYRQEIMKDIESTDLFNYIKRFTQSMQGMRQQLPNTKDFYCKYQKERFFLDAVNIYCDAIKSLNENLARANLKSSGFIAFREYLTNYIESINFTSLYNETKKLLADLSS